MELIFEPEQEPPSRKMLEQAEASLRLEGMAHDKALPFDPLIPNETTIAAMKDVRAGKMEPVTLDDMQAMLDVEN